MLDIYYNIPGIIILNIILKYVPAPLYSNKLEVSEYVIEYNRKHLENIILVNNLCYVPYVSIA